MSVVLQTSGRQFWGGGCRARRIPLTFTLKPAQCRRHKNIFQIFRCFKKKSPTHFSLLLSASPAVAPSDDASPPPFPLCQLGPSFPCESAYGGPGGLQSAPADRAPPPIQPSFPPWQRALAGSITLYFFLWRRPMAKAPATPGGPPLSRVG